MTAPSTSIFAVPEKVVRPPGIRVTARGATPAPAHPPTPIADRAGTAPPAEQASDPAHDLRADAPLVRDPAPIVIGTLHVVPRPTAPATASRDPQLLAILDAPLAPGETSAAGFARKEAELVAAFAQLPVLEARALHARLASPRPGDALADHFARLTADRRHRLLTFLADARRREALAIARRGKPRHGG